MVNKIMSKRLVKISFLALILIFMSLGGATPTNAASSTKMKLEVEWEVILGGPGVMVISGW